MLIENVTITLLPDPDDYRIHEDRGWQEECEEIYLYLKENLAQDQITIKPTVKAGSENKRGTDFYYLLSATIASIGGFKTLYDFLKLWIENRNLNRERVSVNITIGNNEINITNMSKDDAVALFEKYREEQSK
jgi:hypothetical protein